MKFNKMRQRGVYNIGIMCENFLSILKGCSSSNKQKFSSFLQQLFGQQSKQQPQMHLQLEGIFAKYTKQFSLSKIRQISKSERCKKDLTNYQYNYGQIAFKTIFQIVATIKKYRTLGKNEVFYDLGSGSGKVLFAASLCHPFTKCKGIEYLQSLYQASRQLKERIETECAGIEEEVNDVLEGDYRMPSIEIYNENFQRMNWSDGTVIFVSSTCYTREVMGKIEALCDKLQPGTVLITLTRSIENENSSWKLLEKFQGDTSWGPCTVFIHSRGQ